MSDVPGIIKHADGQLELDVEALGEMLPSQAATAIAHFLVTTVPNCVGMLVVYFHKGGRTSSAGACAEGGPVRMILAMDEVLSAHFKGAPRPVAPPPDDPGAN
jgi:hypothetical protein